MQVDAVAIVPAGGAARRLGPRGVAGKAALVADGRTFLERVCAVLAAEVGRVIVVAAPDTALPPIVTPVEVIRDSRPGAGPLAAVRDGLVHALAADPPPRLAMLCSCDVPLVKPDVVRLLLNRVGVPGVRWALPTVGGHPQPLVSVIAVDVLAEIDASLAAAGGSLRDLADSIARRDPAALCRVGEDELRAVDPALDSFRDVDTTEDLADLVRRGSRPRRR